jgi:hypothetical protein
MIRQNKNGKRHHTDAGMQFILHHQRIFFSSFLFLFPNCTGMMAVNLVVRALDVCLYM